MEIVRGKILSAKKVVIYGPEGIGKSTMASRFPEPLFIDTEGSTKDMDVARTQAPSSWVMLLDQVTYVKNHPELCRTLIIDTADWAELLCSDHICQKSQKSGIEDFGYGKGYVYLQEEFGRLLNQLEEIVQRGIHVVLTAHAKMRKFEQPDEMGAYDRWEMKLSKQVAPMVKEWADMVLFANYKTYVINVDGQGAQKGKNKAQGGKRVMYTTHHSCWDAKNRSGLPDEVPFEYESISHILEQTERRAAHKDVAIPESARAQTESLQDAKPQTLYQTEQRPKEEPVSNPAPVQAPSAETKPDENLDAQSGMVAEQQRLPQTALPDTIPKPLRDLMVQYNVDEWDIQNAVEYKGYFPEGTPLENYPDDFVMGCLVGAWPQVYAIIKMLREKEEIPFEGGKR